MKNSKQKQKKQTNKGETLSTNVTPGKELRFFNSESRGAPAKLRRRLTTVAGVTATTGNVFAFAQASGNVTTTTEWSQLSANYQQYRVRAVRVIIVPKNYNNMGFAATVWFPGSVVFARYPSGSAGATLAAIWAQSGSRLHCCESKMLTQMATMEDNPDSALWTDCNAGAPPALSQYGVQFLGSTAAPAIYNTVVVADAYTEYDVEFLARN